MYSYAPWLAAARRVARLRFVPRYPTCSNSVRVRLVSNQTESQPESAPEETANPSTLHRSRGVLCRLLSRPYKDTARINASDQLIAAATELLSRQASQDSVSLAVYGPDSSAVHSFVTALLEDPLTFDETVRAGLRDRWKGIEKDVLQFTYAPSFASQDGIISLPTFLSQFPVPVVLQEFRVSHSYLDPSFPTFLVSDIPILVLSFQSTDRAGLQSLLELLPRNPNRVVVICLTEDSGARSLIALQSVELGEGAIIVNVGRAHRGLDALHKEPTSPSAIRQYQDDFLGSQVPEVINVLKKTAKKGISQLRTDAANALSRQIVDVSRYLLRQSLEEIENAQASISDLRSTTLEKREEAVLIVLGGEEAADVTEKGSIALRIERAAKDIKPTMDSLKWWKLPVIVDEVSQRVGSAVQVAYMKEFQNNLVFCAGHLSVIQALLLEDTHTVLSAVSPSLHSSVLTNSIAQKCTSPSFALTPASLLGPLQYRLHQLTYPTRALHLAAQRALFTTFLTSAVSTASAYSAWLSAYADLSSASAAGLLGMALGLRWAVGIWERAKKDWWGDWRRVGEGLERDLRKTLREVLDKQVCSVPEEACRGLTELVEKKRKEIEAIENELDRLGVSEEGAERPKDQK